MPTRIPTDELLRAMLIEAESIVNARPLTFVPLENDDDEALTPNHFLLGSSNGISSPGEFSSDDLIRRKNWRKANTFWQRWTKEYLPTIARRGKWFENTKNLEVGDVVIVVDSNLPRNCCPKGRIIATKNGSDGTVRSVTVQTKDGVYERPTVKCALASPKAFGH